MKRENLDEALSKLPAGSRETFKTAIGTIQNIIQLHTDWILAHYDGNDLRIEEIEREVDERPLSVEVRSGWSVTSAQWTADEFRILLGTGGPAFQIVGEVSDYGEALNPQMQYQDWHQPWTSVGWCDDVVKDEFEGEGKAALHWFSNRFYFGEG